MFTFNIKGNVTKKNLIYLVFYLNFAQITKRNKSLITVLLYKKWANNNKIDKQ